MNEKQKKIAIIAVIAIIVIIFIVIITNKRNNKTEIKVDDVINEISNNQSEILTQTLEDGTKMNTSTKLQETKELNGLQIKESQLTNNNGITTLLATVENTTENVIEKQKVIITFIDSKGNEIKTAKGIISKLEAKENTQLNISITGDYTDIYDYKIEIQ